MGNKYFSSLLDEWHDYSAKMSDLVSKEVVVHKEDALKLEALAELYKLPREVVTSELIHRALIAIEEEMPYVQGSKVIRVEDGDNIYEDIGPMPDYLAAIEKLRTK